MTKRKKLLYFVARATMTLLVMLLTTTTAWAQDVDDVASVTVGNKTTYYSIFYDSNDETDDAISAAIAAYDPASGDNPATIPTVTLLQDISLDYISICNGLYEVAVILDLNSKTISGGVNIDVLATLTITDNSPNKVGKIFYEGDYCIINDGELIIEGGEISGGYENTILNNGTMTLTSGSIVATSEYEPVGIKNNGTLTVNGGTISAVGGYYPGVAIENCNELTISGGNIINSGIGIDSYDIGSEYFPTPFFIMTALPTFSGNEVDICLGDMVIEFFENISTAPTSPIKVDLYDTYPPFTKDYGTYCADIPPYRMFQYVGDISNVFVGHVSNGEAKMMTGCMLKDDSNNNSTIESWTNKYCHYIQIYGRTLYRNGDWNTLCLPFSMTESQIANSGLSGATIKELDAGASSLAEGGVMTLTFKDATADSQDGNKIIKAGKPYIVRWDASDNLANIIDPVFEEVTISVTEPVAVEFSNAFGSNCLFVGQFSPFLISDGRNDDQNQPTVDNIKDIMMMGSGNTVGYSNTPRELKCFRAHFEIPATAEARAFQINFDDEDLTGIVNIERQSLGDERSAGTWYSLDGRRLSTEPQLKGIYIHNGKKVIIK